MSAFLYNAQRFQGDGCRYSQHRYRGPLMVDRTILHVKCPPHANFGGRWRWKEDYFIDFCEQQGIDLVIAYSGLKQVDTNMERTDHGVLLQFHTEADALLFKLSYTR